MYRLHPGIYSANSHAGIISSLAPAAWFRNGTGITGSATCTAWADQSGNGRNLLEVAGSGPVNLAYSGTRYGYLPGVAGNYFSTPDVALGADLDVRFRVSLVDWTPGATTCLVDKTGADPNRAFTIQVAATTGLLNLLWYPTGSVASLLSAASSVAPTVSDGAALWIRVTLDVDDGAGGNVTTFYTAADSETMPSSWTQLGTATTKVGTTTVPDTNAAIYLGNRAGAADPASGRIYRASIYSTIGGTTPVVDFNPQADAVDGSASFTSSATSEVWTVNTSGALPAQIVGRSSLLFNGTSHYLKCNAFTLNQPLTTYILGKQLAWTEDDRWFDGNTADSVTVYQHTGTPKIGVFAGGTVSAGVEPMTIGTTAVLAAVINGASTLVAVNNSAGTTHALAGSANAAGFTLGARGNGTLSWINAQMQEVIIFPAAHDASQRARVIRSLSRVGQLGV